jgi:hypothetical protein
VKTLDFGADLDTMAIVVKGGRKRESLKGREDFF